MPVKMQMLYPFTLPHGSGSFGCRMPNWKVQHSPLNRDGGIRGRESWARDDLNVSLASQRWLSEPIVDWAGGTSHGTLGSTIYGQLILIVHQPLRIVGVIRSAFWPNDVGRGWGANH